MSMRDSAIVMHEQYTSLLEAGFTPAQALYLVASLACGGPNPPGGPEKGGAQ